MVSVAMADQDSRIKDLEERVAQLEARIAELENGGFAAAEQVFNDLGRATARGGRKAAKAAEGLLSKGLERVRHSLRDDDASDGDPTP